jgi:hypothetical protein
VFTTNNREEAVQLLTLACGTNKAGQFVARELAEEQNMERLHQFTERLGKLYGMLNFS